MAWPSAATTHGGHMKANDSSYTEEMRSLTPKASDTCSTHKPSSLQIILWELRFLIALQTVGACETIPVPLLQ
jgi:hypothetical protein